MDVNSPLGLDTNVMVVGETVTIKVREVEQQSGDQDECPVTATSTPSSAEVVVVEDLEHEITEDRRDWENESDMTQLQAVGGHTRVNFLVTFLPEEAVEYTLSVKCRGQHVPGSPFSVVAISSTSEGDSQQCPGVNAGEAVTFALPKSWNSRAVSPTVLVGGPQGGCEVFSRSGRNSISFLPNQPGSYIISLQSDKDTGEELEKYCITATSNDMGASKCYVVPSDLSVFQKPIRFTKGSKVSFRVHTKQAYGMSMLRVVARGPSEASVTISEVTSGEENVVFQPSSPGRYTLDVLWSGYHIQDSPFTLYFRKPKSPVESNGLDLSKEVLVINVPFHFKLSCKDAEEGDIQVYSVPPSAASIKVTPSGSSNTYHCEIIPRECGTHYVSVQLQGINIPGSPFAVQFRPRGDHTQCRLESVLRRVQSSPTLKFFVNTEGAGEGKLTAVVVEEVTKEKMVASVNRLDGGRHMVQFTPGRGLECKLGVLYDGKHIPGSPYPLLFPGAASFSVEGDGLIRATANRWSLFTVHSVNAGSGVFSVSIEGPVNTNIAPTITSKGPNVFDVRYLPSKEGEYLVFVRWGQHQIPGSPFTVECVSEESLTHFTIWRPSNRIPYGAPIEFTVEDGRTDIEKLKDKSPLSVKAKAQHTSEMLTALTSKDNDGNIYCQFPPPDPGSYSVTVRNRGVELPGSPFRVTIPCPPRAEGVRVWGQGLQDHHLSPGDHASTFMVDTTDAGSGVLGIKVRAIVQLSCMSTRSL